MHTQNAAMLGHEAGCSCHKCFANAMGSWIDELGARTSPGQFQVFGTTTFRTPTYPWQRGFPTGGAGRPSPDYAHHLFGRLVSHLERELGSTPDYVVADQYGALGGRFHQHWILAGNGLDAYPRREIWEWLKQRAGWSRVVPFERGAAYYISRYIGRDAQACDWQVRIGPELSSQQPPLQLRGRLVVARTPEMPRECFHNTLTRWHR